MGNPHQERNLCPVLGVGSAVLGFALGLCGLLGWLSWSTVGPLLTLGCLGVLILMPIVSRMTRADWMRRRHDLDQRQALLETVLDQLPAGIIVLDPTGTVLRMNRQSQDLFGPPPTRESRSAASISVDPVVTRSDGSVVSWKDWSGIWTVDSNQTTTQNEVSLQHPDRGPVQLRVSSTPVHCPTGQRLGAVSVLVDLTDRKRNEDRLRLLESSVVHARDAIIVLEALPSVGQGRAVRYVNEAFTRMTGYSSDEVIGRSLHILRGPKTNPETLDRLRTALDAQTPLHAELLNYRKDGSELWVDLSLVPVFDSEGVCIHWVMIQRDIGDRKRADAALRASEELFRSVFENAGAGVSLVGTDGTFTSVNPAFAAMLGRHPDEIVGHYPAEFSHPDDWAEQQDLLKEVALGHRNGYHIRKRYIKPSGEYVWTELTVVVVRGSELDYRYSLGVSVDVTERRQLEDQLRQAQKMEVVGQLAGGIAHDFNNLLTGIIGNLDQIQLPIDDPNNDLVAAAERAAVRAADLTRKMLGFARKNQLHVAPCQVGDFVHEVLTLLRRTLDPRIEVVAELDPDLWVLADATLMNQSLLNLCLNARDAMPQGGTLTVRAAAVEVTPADTLHPEARAGLFARLTVSDTGVGMTPDVKARLFEPFFTTKEVGKGTGLGLAMVHGIARQHGGWVECDSSPGLGTRFDLFLPLRTEPVPAPPTPAPRAAIELHSRTLSPDVATPLPGEMPTILLVDDEDMIRDLGRSVLEAAGYRILEAIDGSDAVEVFRREQARIDLVILDLTMPRLSGRDAFRFITEIAPDARVLFSSGYSSDDVSDLAGSLGLLAKPYRPQELVSMVRRSLAVPRSIPGSVPAGAENLARCFGDTTGPVAQV